MHVYGLKISDIMKRHWRPWHT